MFDELDHYLNTEYNVNHWSDDAIDRAIDLLDSLDDADWATLEQTWSQRPVYWQTQLANAVYGSEKPRVPDLLVAMLHSPHMPVALAAADSLWAKDDVWTPTAELRPTLEHLRAHVNADEQRTIDEIVARIPA